MSITGVNGKIPSLHIGRGEDDFFYEPGCNANVSPQEYWTQLYNGTMQIASEGVAEGKPFAAIDLAIGLARDYAARAGVSFDGEAARNIFRAGFEMKMMEADDYATSGNVILTEYSISQARGYAVRAGIVFDEDAASRIIRRAYSQAYDIRMKGAENFAAAGNAVEMERVLEEARQYIEGAGIDPAAHERRASQIRTLLQTQ